jgi:hypothetical protein
VSWARTKATGSGRLRFRVSIDGIPVEFVTSKEMETTVSGRTRYVGLNTDGIKIGERCDLVLGKLTAESMRIKIADVNKRATALFAKKPTAVTYLAASMDDADTSMTVLGTDAFPSSGNLYIDTETIAYDSKDATHFLDLTRTRFGSNAQYHYTVDGERQAYPEVADWPSIYVGRRCRLYVYGDGDSPTGNGTQIWVGIVRTEPRYDGGRWSFGLDPPTSLFSQKLGADLKDPTGIRGIYYPATAPLIVSIVEFDTDFNGSDIQAVVRFAKSGFWEDQRSFLTSLNANIQTALAAPDDGTFTQTAVYAIEWGSSWAVRFDTDAASAKYMQITTTSAIDSHLREYPIDTSDPTGPQIDTVATSRAYQYLPTNEAFGSVPRAVFGAYPPSSSIARDLDDAKKFDVNPDTYPSFRIYLGGGSSITSNTSAVQVEWKSSGNDSDSAGSETFIVNDIDARSSANRSVDLSRPPTINSLAGVQWYAYAGGEMPQIRQGRSYGSGNFADFLAAVTDIGDTAEYLNLGAWVDLTVTDIDVSGSTTEIDAATGSSPFANSRGYSVFGEVTLDELIQQECRLAGVFPCLASTGQITFRRLRHAAPAEVVDAEITATSAIVDDQWLTWEPSALGMFNTVVLRTGYDPIEDDHKGTVWNLRDVAAFGKQPVANTLEIKPYSTDPPTLGLDFTTLAPIASRLFSVFAGSYALLHVEVPLTHFHVLLGDVVSITWAKVPNAEGTLGVTDKTGIVVGREWMLREAKGKLTILTTDRKIGGYAPSFKIDGSITGADASTGPFTVAAASGYLPTGTDTTDFWVIGDKIRLLRWDSTTSTSVLGTITSVPGGGQLIFTTDSNWTHSAGSWFLDPQISTSITADNQKVDVFIANANSTLDFGGGDTANKPFVFA